MANILRVIPLGGLGEIGRNMCLFEYGDDIIVVDVGLMFPEEEMLGVDLVIPDFTYLRENKEKLRAVFLTHGHEDHVGALPYFRREFNVPIYSAKLTDGLIRVKLQEHRLLQESETHVIECGQVIPAGAFEVEFFPVAHSIPDACGLIIKTPLGTVVHTGDFKLDHTPVMDQHTDLIRLAQVGAEGCLLLMADSTYAEQEGYTPSEQLVGEAIRNILVNARGRVIIATFASLISRVQQVVDVLTARIEPTGEGGAFHLLGLVQAAVPLVATGQVTAARQLLDELIRVTSAMTERDPDAAGPMHSARTLRAMIEGDYGTAYRDMQAATAVFERMGRIRAELEHRAGAGFCALEVGDLPGGETLLRRVIERSRELGYEHVDAVARHNLGRRIGEAGRFAEGMQLEHEALASFERHGNRRMTGLTHCHLAWLLLEQGHVAEAADRVERGLALLEERSPSRLIALATRGQIRLRQLDHEGALADARAAIEGLESLGQVQEGESLIRLTWAEALAAAGREAESRTAIAAAHRRLLERARRIEDDELRTSFLERVPENARIVARLGALLGPEAPASRDLAGTEPPTP